MNPLKLLLCLWNGHEYDERIGEYYMYTYCETHERCSKCGHTREIGSKIDFGRKA